MNDECSNFISYVTQKLLWIINQVKYFLNRSYNNKACTRTKFSGKINM